MDESIFAYTDIILTIQTAAVLILLIAFLFLLNRFNALQVRLNRLEEATRKEEKPAAEGKEPAAEGGETADQETAAVRAAEVPAEAAAVPVQMPRADGGEPETVAAIMAVLASCGYVPLAIRPVRKKKEYNAHWRMAGRLARMK